MRLGSLPPFVQRLVKGVAASLYGQAAITLIQFVTVPALVSLWGANRYGLWVMLNTITGYLGLSDFGFATAAMADMSWKLGAGDRLGARATYHSVKLLIIAITGVILLGAAATWLVLSIVFPADDYLGPHSALAVALIVVYAAMLVRRTSWVGALRATGNLAASTVTDNTTFLFENAAVIAAAWSGAGFALCAAAAIAARTAGNLVLWRLLRRRAPDIESGYAGASWKEIRRLFGPAIAVGAMPAALAVSLQGAVIVVGAIVSPAAAAVFNTTRTICRVTVQLTHLVSSVSVPELAYAMAGGRDKHVATIMMANAAVILLCVVPITLVIGLFGRDVILLWTIGKIAPTRLFVAIMAVGTMFHACWWTSAYLMLSAQLQAKFVYHFLAYSVLAILASLPLTMYFHGNGAAAVMMVSDAAMCLRVFHVLKGTELFRPKAVLAQAQDLARRLPLLLANKMRGPQ